MIHPNITLSIAVRLSIALISIASWGCKNSDPAAAPPNNFIETLHQVKRCQVEISNVSDSVNYITFYESSRHGGADSWEDATVGTQLIGFSVSNFDSVVSGADSVVYSHDSTYTLGFMTYANIARLSIVVDSLNATIKKIRIYNYV
ncbi:MAG TPA: hypothetical protein VFO76_06005, partial [Candidatus Kapabacteria bacterium]|nr:hypothetical protein [Candidatus Kapabacteria bacterium]